ncbi:serine hydrolase domain-containing protein [Streptomyces sp. NPDC046727]|uniref:serine hydrolase domain-containing protein n=1 Tax=Streptomyces sp. NPDC046727 TaxID=3155373 RepID=UPI0033D6E6FA
MTADENSTRHEASAQPTATQDRFDAAVAALRASAQAEGAPGASVAVFADGRLRVAHHGHDGHPTDRPRTDASRQHIACLSKVVIAYVCLMLVERGLVGLDEPLGDKLPEAVRRRGGRTVGITLRHLLTHSSGIDDSRENWAENDTSDLAAYVARFDDYPQVFEPGRIFSYSDCGTAIAALLIERLLGIPWRRAANEMLLEPLGIMPVPEHRDFVAYYGDSVSRGHEWDASVGRFEALPLEQVAAVDDNLGTNSLCFTIEEIVALARLALNDGVGPKGERLLSAELAREMRAPQMDVPAHHLVHSWGLGWLHFDDRSFGFEAAGPGHQSVVQIFPEQQQILVVLGNINPSLVLYYDVLRAFNGGPWKDTTPKRIDARLCLGTYSADGHRMVLSEGRSRPRYRYFQRVAQDDWQETDFGELVPSSIGAFTWKSAKKLWRSTITPIWSSGDSRPDFLRFGLQVLKRDESTDAAG